MMSPKFSIIIPVLREEPVIESTIKHLALIGRSVPFETIVVDGDGQGETIGFIKNRDVKTAVSQKGRGLQMNTGAAMAQGEILIFLHADTRLPPGALDLIESAFRDRTCVAGAFDLKIGSERSVHRLIAKLASLRSRVSRIPYGDQVFFFRRSYFQALGGFASIPIMEDVEIMRRIKKRGEKITILDQPAITSARRWEKEGVLLCTLRNWLLISLYLAGASPEWLSGFYKK